MFLGNRFRRWLRSRIPMICNKATPRKSLRLGLEALESRITPVSGTLGPATFTPATQVEGYVVTISGHFTDDTPTDMPTMNIDWSDGQQSNHLPLDFSAGGGNYSVQHIFTEAGSYTAFVKLRAGDNTLLDAVAKNIIITEASLTGLATPAQSPPEGTATQIIVGTFDDANPYADETNFSGTITWGARSEEHTSELQ